MQFLFLVLFIVLQTIVDLPFISLVVCLAMLFYVIIRKPYNKNRDNNRAILNLIVLMCAISLKVFMFYWPEEQQRYLLVYIVLLAILMLLFAILIFSIIFIIYDYYLDINAEN